jgi:hypothetical protein
MTLHLVVNPWTWQDQFGFAHAVTTSTSPSRWVLCAGQGSVDVDGLLGQWHVLAERMGKANCRPSSTLLGVARLAFPDMLVEIEATALAE